MVKITQNLYNCKTNNCKHFCNCAMRIKSHILVVQAVVVTLVNFSVHSKALPDLDADYCNWLPSLLQVDDLVLE